MIKYPRISLFFASACLALAGFNSLAFAQGSSPDLLTTGPAPKGDAWTPAWGFWPNVPMAWQQTFRGQVADVKKGPAEVVFLGDSITAGWLKSGKEVWKEHLSPLGAVNLGIGGDTTRQVLWRLEQGTLDGAKPKLIVLLIGVNNIFTMTGSDQDIVRGIEEVVKQLQVKCPQSKILVLGIFPLNNTAQTERTQKINALVEKKLAPDVRFLDLSSKFQGADGKILADLYSKDGTHLEAAGYGVWWQNLQPTLEELLK